MNEELTQLKEATQALLWTMLWTSDDASHGEVEERAKDRIQRAIDRVNSAWREMKNPSTAPTIKDL